MNITRCRGCGLTAAAAPAGGVPWKQRSTLNASCALRTFVASLQMFFAAAALCPSPNFVALDQLFQSGCVANIPFLGSTSANRTSLGFRSQFGQDEWIFNNVFVRIPNITDGFFVEFGARDGIEG